MGIEGAFGDVAALNADNPAFGDEQLAHIDRRSQQPARIESQVQDEPAHPLLFQFCEHVLQAAALSRPKATSRT